MEGIGKRRSRGLLLKDGIKRRETGREKKGNQSYQYQGQVAIKASSKAFAFKTKVTFHNMHRNKRIKSYFVML